MVIGISLHPLASDNVEERYGKEANTDNYENSVEHFVLSFQPVSFKAQFRAA